jgi:3-deoxy-D-manno-octulosonic-acid transferase
MQRILALIYSVIVLPLLWVLLQIAGLFNAKVRRGINGRKELFEKLATAMAASPQGQRVWFHSSSMGEFEQAKPIIAELKRRSPDVRVIVTFFSPSGYEHSRTYQHADAVSYIPFDTRRSAQRFLDLVRPDAAVMVRYDIWPNHIWALRDRGIPTLIANATMRRGTKRRLPLVRAFHREVYDAITAILTVSQSDVEAFRMFSLRKPLLQAIGDTRFDQVSGRCAQARKHHLIPQRVLDGKQVIVVGSSWPEDMAVLLPTLHELTDTHPNLLTIIVPHEPTVEALEELEIGLGNSIRSIRFSALNEYAGEQVLIVDSVGILMMLYQYAHIAYVGGSFRQGVHNVLEAAVYGIPVVFGPRHRNSHEPLMLVERGGGFVVNDTQELTRTLGSLLDNEAVRSAAGDRSAQFVRANLGATDRFLAQLEPYLQHHAK